MKHFNFVCATFGDNGCNKNLLPTKIQKDVFATNQITFCNNGEKLM